MITKIDDFIKRVESTAEKDLFTPRTFYHLSSSTFHEMCELLKGQEAKTGHWNGPECSHCHAILEKRANYEWCPHCGAHMIQE